MAADPYKKAVSLLQKHCGEPEPIQSDSMQDWNGHTLQSDARPINQSTNK